MIFTLLRIAFRNLFSHKRRTILTLLIISCGASGIILLGGFFNGMVTGLREKFIHSQTGHMEVNAQGYFRKGVSAPFDYLMSRPDEVKKELASVPGVSSVIPRLKFSGIASSEKTGIPVIVLGVDPEGERQMGSYVHSHGASSSVRITDGQDLDDQDPQGVLLGKGLLKAIGLHVGDSLTLITTKANGALDGAEYHVRGTFETISKDFDDRVMKVPVTAARALIGESDAVHSYLVLLNSTALTQGVANELVRRFQEKRMNLEVIPWEQQADYYRSVKALFDKIYGTLLVIVGLVVILSIANTVNMAILERVREFGTMMAIGNSRLVVFGVIVLETSVMAMIGAACGLLLGGLLAVLISRFGIALPQPQGSGYFLVNIVLSPKILMQSFITAVVAAALSSLTPAYRACHFRIIEALGYV